MIEFLYLGMLLRIPAAKLRKISRTAKYFLGMRKRDEGRVKRDEDVGLLGQLGYLP